MIKSGCRIVLLQIALGMGWMLGGASPAMGQQPILLRSEELVESSGLALSLSDSDFIWTHNDSGASPRLYRFNRKNGQLNGVYDLRGASAVDWEDMTSFRMGTKNFLAIGDIGDNHRRRSSVSIHVIGEPPVNAMATAPFLRPERDMVPALVTRRLTLEVTYPTGPVDCEALVFDSQHSRFLLLTKELFRCRVFSVPVDMRLFDSIPLAELQDSLKVEAEYVQTLRIPVVTAADINPDGTVLAIGTYGPAYLLRRDGAVWQEKSMIRVQLPKRRQGEALAFLDSDHLLVTSEFAPTPLWTVGITGGPQGQD
jgi:hypothetical protein